MNSVLLISQAPLKLQSLAAICNTDGNVAFTSAARFVVEGSWGWYAIYLESDDTSEFEPVELEAIKRVFSEPSFAGLEFSDPSAAGRAILNLNTVRPLLVDNDHGMICSADEIERRIRNSKEWIGSRE